MAKKSLDTLTEPMLYVLMSFQQRDMSGVEIANHVKELTNNRVHIGPGTLYTILSNFESVGLIEKKQSEGRRIVYTITEMGLHLYTAEINRLRQCLADAEKGGLHEI